ALEASEKPHHLACMLIRIRAWPAFIGVSLQQASPTRSMAGQGVNHHFIRLARLEVVVSFWVANATREKTRGADWRRHSDRHSPHTDRPDIGTLCPTFRSPTRHCGTRTSRPWRHIWSNTGMSHGGSLRR